MDRSADTGHDRGEHAQVEKRAAAPDVLEAAEQECLARYGALISRPHPDPNHHPRASMAQRAAQFSPFAALTGHGAAIRETARLTERRRELSEDEQTALGDKLTMLAEIAPDHPMVSVTYFRADEKKDDGSYVAAADAVKKIDEYERVIILMDGTRIPIGDISEIESELFEKID